MVPSIVGAPCSWPATSFPALCDGTEFFLTRCLTVDAEQRNSYANTRHAPKIKANFPLEGDTMTNLVNR
jgi:hypothetical protein